MGRKQVVEVKDLFGYDDRQERMVARSNPNLGIVRDDLDDDHSVWERLKEALNLFSRFGDLVQAWDSRGGKLFEKSRGRRHRRHPRRCGDRYKRQWRQGHMQRHLAASKGL